MARWILLTLLTLWSLANMVRAVLALQQAIALPDMPTAFDPAISAALGIVWAGVFAGVAAGAAARKAWFPAAAVLAAVLYQLSLWLGRLLFGRSGFIGLTVNFDLALSLGSIAVVSALAWLAARAEAKRSCG